MTATAQLARDGEQVNAAHPGFTDTAMLHSADQDGLLPALGGFAIPDVAAPAAIAALYPRAVA